MKKIIFSSQFPEDLSTCKRIFGLYGLEKLNHVISILKEGHKLQPKYKDHPLDKYKELKGKGLRDCHIVEIDDNWVLVYKPEKHNLRLLRTGVHKEIFKYSSKT